MKRIFRVTVAFVVLLGLLVTSGCGKKPKKELPMPDFTVPVTEPVKETKPKPEKAEQEDASMQALRQAMVGTNAKFAVAYFGYIDMADPELNMTPFDTMQERAPLLCEDHPWLLEIPEANIVGGTQGFLPQPGNALERPSSTRLEARFPYHGSGAMTRSPSPLAWRPDFPGAPREAH